MMCLIMHTGYGHLIAMFSHFHRENDDQAISSTWSLGYYFQTRIFLESRLQFEVCGGSGDVWDTYSCMKTVTATSCWLDRSSPRPKKACPFFTDFSHS